MSDDPTDADKANLLVRAEEARKEIQQRAQDLLTEAVRVLTKEHGFTREEALGIISIQALEKCVLYINILPEDAKAAVQNIPIISVPVTVTS